MELRIDFNYNECYYLIKTNPDDNTIRFQYIKFGKLKFNETLSIDRINKLFNVRYKNISHFEENIKYADECITGNICDIIIENDLSKPLTPYEYHSWFRFYGELMKKDIEEGEVVYDENKIGTVYIFGEASHANLIYPRHMETALFRVPLDYFYSEMLLLKGVDINMELVDLLSIFDDKFTIRLREILFENRHKASEEYLADLKKVKRKLKIMNLI